MVIDILKRHVFYVHSGLAFCLGCPATAGQLRQFENWGSWAEHVVDLIESEAAA